MKRVINHYFGGKGGAGTYQMIINHIRPHTCYIEPFLGAGSIVLNKRKALTTVCNDKDREIVAVWHKNRFDWLELRNEDALQLLQNYDYAAHEKVCVYLDPPYPLSSRRKQEKVYRCEMSDAEHRQLLELAKSLPSHVDVLISTYPNLLYTQELADWYLVKFYSQTRHGKALEHLYMNYPVVDALHDTSYVGLDYRERERIKKKAHRWTKNFRKLPTGEQQAIFQALCQLPDLTTEPAVPSPGEIPAASAVPAGTNVYGVTNRQLSIFSH